MKANSLGNMVPQGNGKSGKKKSTKKKVTFKPTPKCKHTNRRKDKFGVLCLDCYHRVVFKNGVWVKKNG